MKKSGSAPGLDHGLELLHHLLLRYELFAREVAALLGQSLIFNVQARGACLLPEPDGALRVQHTAVAGVGIGENGQARRTAHATDMLKHVALRQRAHVGLARFDAAGYEAADEDGLCAAGLGQLGRDGIERTHADKRFARLKQRAESLVACHREISFAGIASTGWSMWHTEADHKQR